MIESGSPPNLYGQIVNFASSVVRYTSTGFKKATPEQKAARLEICSICEHRNETKCKLCGCYLNLKSTIASEQCPADKWAEIV